MTPRDMNSPDTLQITVLGTGTSQGVPIIGCNCEVCQSENPRDKRLRTAILIQSETTNVVVDVGPDFRQQMLREKLGHLDAILVTHEHNDHIIGLDDVRPFNFISKKNHQAHTSHKFTGRRSHFYMTYMGTFLLH